MQNDLPLVESFLVLIIFAANSKPVDFWTHRRTTEKAPLHTMPQKLFSQVFSYFHNSWVTFAIPSSQFSAISPLLSQLLGYFRIGSLLEAMKSTLTITGKEMINLAISWWTSEKFPAAKSVLVSSVLISQNENCTHRLSFPPQLNCAGSSWGSSKYKGMKLQMPLWFSLAWINLIKRIFANCLPQM